MGQPINTKHYIHTRLYLNTVLLFECLHLNYVYIDTEKTHTTVTMACISMAVLSVLSAQALRMKISSKLILVQIFLVVHGYC